MNTELLNYFAPEGVWAILSVSLIFYIIKNQEKRDKNQDDREKNYQKIIIGLSESLKDLEEIKKILDEKLDPRE